MLAKIAILSAPLFLWAFLYAIARYSSINMRPLIRWLRIGRWVFWIVAVVLWLAASGRIASSYWTAFFTSSIGLSFPERWLTGRFAPEVIAETTPPDGWWPSKPN